MLKQHVATGIKGMRVDDKTMWEISTLSEQHLKTTLFIAKC